MPTPDEATAAGPDGAVTRGLGLLQESMDAEERQRLLARMPRRDLEPREVLIREGEPSAALYLVCSGRLTVGIEGLGERLEVGEVGPGEWVGEVGLLDPGPATATVAASEPSEVLSLGAADLAALRDEDPELAAPLLRALSLTLARRLRASSRGALRGDASRWHVEARSTPRGGFWRGLLRAMQGGG